MADIITSNFDSTQKEFGIMNTDFEWVVEPSSELYVELCGDDSELNIFHGEDDKFAYNGYYYLQSMSAFLELSTGEVYYYPDIPFEFPVEQSFFNSYYKFVAPDEKVLVDFSKYYDAQNMKLFSGQFNDGYAPILFYNQESNTCFITLIDQKGEMLFEPAEVWVFDRSNAWISGFEVTFDGENILVKHGQFSMKKAKCFNTKGELLGEFEPDTSNRSSSFYIKINDGIIIYYRSLDMNEYEIINYYKPDFTPLF